MIYKGRAEIRTIVSSRLEKARNSDDRTVILDGTTARHASTCMVEMHTNVNIHICAIVRYADTLKNIDGKWFVTNRTRTE